MNFTLIEKTWAESSKIGEAMGERVCRQAAEEADDLLH